MTSFESRLCVRYKRQNNTTKTQTKWYREQNIVYDVFWLYQRDDSFVMCMAIKKYFYFQWIADTKTSEHAAYSITHMITTNVFRSFSTSVG